jgi:outer membrane protein insertion porin family
MFPSAGSSVTLSLEVAPPLPQFIQYHKWRLYSNWNLPIANKLSLGVGLDYSYVGSLVKDEEVQFERFLVGGTPFDAQFGRFGFGKDLVYMRGFPAGAIGLRDADNILQGGTVLNKYTSEIRFMAVRSPQLALQLYGFLDAVNTWNGFQSYSASDLYRSGGMGIRIFLPILGMMNLNYGYNFDAFPAIPGRDSGDKKWRFQFSLGQNF